MSFTVDLFRNAHRIVGVRMRFVLGMKVVTLFETVVNAEFQFFDFRFLFENNTIWDRNSEVYSCDHCMILLNAMACYAYR